MASLRIVVVGGGLAGMAAAVALEGAGFAVTLLESRQSLGGRAGSFEDLKTGEQLDNCQHVLLGCCTNLVDFYRRIGTANHIRYERALHFRDAAGHRYDLWGRPGLPAPLHLGESFIRFGALSATEKVALARAMLAMAALGRGGREALAEVPFGRWLNEHRQPESLVTKLYDPVIISGLNEQTRSASAKYAIQIFQDALLSNRAGYVLGLPSCPLGELYARIPCRDVRLGARVSGLQITGDRVAAVLLQDGREVAADSVVLATNYHTMQRWIPGRWTRDDSRFSGLDRLESVPILGAHLWFDRPVMTESHAALISGPLQWAFRKDEQGRSVHGVISAAREWVSQPKQDLLAQFESQILATFPGAQGARLERGVIVIEKRATFSPLPGVDRFRPAQEPPLGGLRNLFLAGDYTRTGWPATMEGAVRSGYLAAEAVLKSLSIRARRSNLVDDLPVEWPARLLGLG